MSAFSAFLANETAVVTDPGDAAALPTNGGRVYLTTTGTTTRTLANPTRDGVFLFLVQTAASGTITVTVASAINAQGSTILTYRNQYE